ncbi:hypothetical protein GTS_40490 [Gandjariella thermophila]|uniref:Uncharacterized protein n=1 Tax=Gandjariella thermophila TaxID=1931992 RepID=A0A4D4JDE3_9PSEU|nr:hypothetical protein GTS_40490 [Gandjariella thermophila]
MNISTPSTMWTPSLVTEPGMASDHRPDAASSTPRTIIVHIAPVVVLTASGERANTTPRTTAAQSCHLVHGLAVALSVDSAITITSGPGVPRPKGKERKTTEEAASSSALVGRPVKALLRAVRPCGGRERSPYGGKPGCHRSQRDHWIVY